MDKEQIKKDMLGIKDALESDSPSYALKYSAAPMDCRGRLQAAAKKRELVWGAFRKEIIPITYI